MSLTGFLSYSRVNWQQSPSKSTPWNATNLNIMDKGIKDNNDMISNLRDEVTQLNSNMITMGGMIINGSIEYDSAIFVGKETKPLFIHAIGTSDVSNIKGMPQGAYGYGALITIMNVVDNNLMEWGSGQIYIPHNNTNVYIRIFADNNFSTWRKLEGTIVSKVS